jgi:hypothetical protein
MTIIPLNFTISRNPETQKKVYTSITTKEQSHIQMNLPKDWSSHTYQGSQKLTPSYAIRPDDTLVVIDCDDLASTHAISNLVTSDNDYIVVSDKGEKHFYYEPTDYYKNSRIYRTSKIKAGAKIDVLHGNGCYVFASCALNHTKQDLQGSIIALTPIPDSIVDYLVAQLKEETTHTSGDYSPVTSYLAPLIEQSLALYARTKDYRDIQNMLALITPNAFKSEVQPDFHPDRVQAGNGIEYLKGMRAKLGRDPSISLQLAIEVITLVSQQLWSAPLSNRELENITQDLAIRTYDDGTPIFIYDPNATSQPLVSMNGYPYMPVYRTIDDEFVIAKVNGQVELIKGLSNFKKTVVSKNFSLLYDKTEVRVASQIPRVTEQMESVRILNVPYENPGVYDDNGTLVYNTYVPTRYLSIIRGNYLQEQKYKVGTTPTIDALLNNLTADHAPESKMVSKLEQFLSYKLKTLEHSPIVFQLMGNRGTGKGTFITLLNIITNLTVRTKLNASNSQFNSDMAGKLFLNEDEGFVTSNLVNLLKEYSGNKETRIEAKGKEAIMLRNIGTYIFSSNQPQLLAETIDDRRFVVLSSFTAEKLQIAKLEDNIIFEAEAWCLKLRDIKLSNTWLYTNATLWHDHIHMDLFKERTENIQDAPGQLAYLITTLMNNLTGEQLKKQLEDILGVGFHYNTTQKGIKIYLANKSAAPIRKSDHSIVQHSIKSTDIKNIGLGAYKKTDSNCSVYDKKIDYLYLDLSQQQLTAFSSIETVEPLEV